MESAEKDSALASRKRIGIDETPSRDCESITALGYVGPGTHAAGLGRASSHRAVDISIWNSSAKDQLQGMRSIASQQPGRIAQFHPTHYYFTGRQVPRLRGSGTGRVPRCP